MVQPHTNAFYLDVAEGGVVAEHLAVDEPHQVLLHLLRERRLSSERAGGVMGLGCGEW